MKQGRLQQVGMLALVFTLLFMFASTLNVVTAADATSTSCGYVNSDLTLTSNISVNGTCFTINASHVTIDGAGFSIFGNASSDGINDTRNHINITIKNFGLIQNFTKSIVLDGANDTTIINVTIQSANVTDEIGVHMSSELIDFTENVTIVDSKITMMANDSVGIKFNSVINSLIEFVTIVQNGTLTPSTGAICGEPCFHSGADGILISTSDNNTLRHLDITLTATGNALYISRSDNNSVSNITINNTGESGWGLYNVKSTGGIFRNITILTHESEGYGVQNRDSNFSLYHNLTITTLNLSSYGFHMYQAILDTNNNTIYNSLINSTGYNIYSETNSTSSLIFNDSLGQINWFRSNHTNNLTLQIGKNIFIENNSVGFTDNTSGMALNGSAMIEIRNISYLVAPSLLKNGAACEETELCNLTYDTTTNITTANVSSFSNYSTQDITPPTNVSNLENLSHGDTWIYWNWSDPADLDFNTSIIFLNGTNLANTTDSFYNATGLSDGTHYNLTVQTVDHSNNINTTNISNSFFTLVTPPSACGTLTESTTLINNISVNGTCFTIGADNIVLDGGGFAIFGDGTSIGIDNEMSYDNVTIKNFKLIRNFTRGISLNESHNNTIFNNTIETGLQDTSRGILVYNISSSTNISYTNVSCLSNSCDSIRVQLSNNSYIEFSNLSNSKDGDAFVSISSDYTTLRHSELNSVGSDDAAIFSVSPYANVSSNTFLAGDDGLIISASDYSVVFNNTIITTSSTDEALDLTSSSDFVTVSHNNITHVSTTSGSHAIQVDSGNSIDLQNNIINTSAGYGFHVTAGSNHNISSNTIETSGASAFGIYTSISSALVFNNTITTTGNLADAIRAINITNTYEENVITTKGTNSNAFFFNQSSHHVVQNNVVTTSGSSSHGIYLNMSTNTTIDSNNITTNGTGVGIYLDTTVNNTLVLNTNISSEIANEINDSTGDSQVNYLVYNNSLGEIRWINRSDGAFLKDMDVNGTLSFGETIFIGNNTVSFNTSSFSTNLINSSANITLRGINLSSATAVFKYPLFNTNFSTIKDNGTDCVMEGTCEILTYNSTSKVLVLNTTSFSSFIASDEIVCSGITQSTTLNRNITTSGDCFVVNASNIVLDGGGYFISGDGTGYGINVTDFTNVTIKNFGGINNFSQGVHASTMKNGSVRNNSITTGTASGSRGIVFDSNSHLSNATNNSISCISTNCNTVRIDSSDNVTVSDSKLSSTGSGDVIYFIYANKTSIISNNITSTSSSNAIECASLKLGNISNNIMEVGSADGIVYSSCNYMEFSRNNITMNTFADDALDLKSNSDHNLIIGNNISQTSGLIGNHIGVLITSGTNTTIASNVISTLSGIGYGVSLVSGADSNVSNNVISTAGASANGIHTTAPNGTILHNNVTTTGTSGRGIWVQQDNFVVEKNIVNTTNTGAEGLYLSGADDTQIVRNQIHTSGSSADGVYVSNSRTTYLDSNIVNSNNTGHGIYLDSSADLNDLVNNNITSTNGNEIEDDSGSDDINYLIYNNSFGEIKWINSSSSTFLEDLDVNDTNGNGLGLGLNLFIGNNTASLNTSEFSTTLMNSSANITFKGLNLADVTEIFKFHGFDTNSTSIVDNGTDCLDDGCTLITFNSSTGILVFNTTSFSSFASADSTPPTQVTNIINYSRESSWIYWNWSNPNDSDFSQNIIFINGTNVVNTSDNFYNATGLSASVNHTITIHTKDTDGNINDTDSNASALTLFTIFPSFPKDGQTYNTLDLFIRTSSSNNKSTTCWYDFNSGGNTTYDCLSEPTITANEGSNTLSFYANDSYNQTVSSSVTFNVNTSLLLVISITDPANNTESTAAAPTLSLLAVDKQYSSINYTLYTYYENDSLYSISNNGTLENNTETQVTLSPSLALIGANTTYKIIANASDEGNNNATSQILYYTIMEPVVSLVSPPINYWNNTGDITFSFTVLDSVYNTLNCSIYLDDTLNQTNATAVADNVTTTFFTINDIPDSINSTWKVQCINSGGGSGFDSRLFSVDTIPPTITTINATPNPLEVSTIVNITSNASDDIEIQNVTVNISGSVFVMVDLGNDIYSYEYNTSNLGLYNYTIQVTDMAGNTVSNSSNFTVQDTIPPGVITNLTNLSQSSTWIFWNWTNPLDADFNETILYLNSDNIANTTDSFYNATGLSSSTEYNLTINTIDSNNNTNTTNVSSTVTTSSVSSSSSSSSSSGGGGGGGSSGGSGGGTATNVTCDPGFELIGNSCEKITDDTVQEPEAEVEEQESEPETPEPTVISNIAGMAADLGKSVGKNPWYALGTLALLLILVPLTHVLLNRRVDPLEKWMYSMFKRGFTSSDVKGELQGSSWASSKINLSLHKVEVSLLLRTHYNLSSRRMRGLTKFIQDEIKNGATKNEIIIDLVNQGWSEGLMEQYVRILMKAAK